jgi:Protein of unknown function (DUF3579)
MSCIYCNSADYFSKSYIRYNARCSNYSHKQQATSRADTESLMALLASDVVIQGITENGRAFRPSDWAERLCGIMSSFGADEQLRYSSHVRPTTIDGVGCVVISGELASIEPRVYQFLMDFANDNDLNIIDPSKPFSENEVCEVPGAAANDLLKTLTKRPV